MKYLASCGVIVVSLWASAGFAKDHIDRYARFWAAILAVEDKCETYISWTQALRRDIAGLSATEYDIAREQLPVLRKAWEKKIRPMSCEVAARAVLDFTDQTFDQVWEQAE